jgi:FKBP-type peptidyl-prolyl cis-trans isomerase FkpA
VRNLLFLLAVATTAITFTACNKGGSTDFTDSKFGFKYKLHTDGKGVKPKAGDAISFHQYVRKGDSLIQSTRKMGNEPLQIQIPTDAKGDKFIEAVKMMGLGDSMTLAIVIDSLGAGAVRPPFKSGELIYFDFKMVEIKNAKDVEAELAVVKTKEESLHKALDATLADYRAGKLKTQTTASGLKYIINEQGAGAKPQAGKPVSVHYIGVAKDGVEFDNSFKRGQPISFPLGQGQVIKGWDEGIALLNVGGKGVFFIPGNLAYGATPPPGSPIKPNAELVFYVELVK